MLCERLAGDGKPDSALTLKFPHRDRNIGLACFGIGITMPA